jgi:hypothetical protein
MRGRGYSPGLRPIRVVFVAVILFEHYLRVLPLLLSGRLRLLDNEKLRKQFISLERTLHAGGRETVEERFRAGSHDDLCDVVSAAAVLASEASISSIAVPS